jgi:hypothetical protein
MLEALQRAFYAASALKRRKAALALYFLALPVLVAVSAGMKSFALAGATIGFWLLTFLFNFIYDGIRNKSYLFRRARSAAFGMSLKSWVGAILGGAAGLGLLYLLGWLPYWIGGGVLAACAAAAYQFGVARPLAAQRADAIWKMQEMLKELRVRGVAEEAVQAFVARFSGVHWEEFFEALFGYEDVVAARADVAGMEKVRQRKRHGVWRDSIIQWLDGIEERRKQAREQRQLERVEANRLKARGMSDDEAKAMAAEEATRILKDVHVAPVTEKQVRKAKARISRRLQASTAKRLFAVGRAALGLAMIAAFAALYAGNAGLTLPGALSDFLGRYWSWGHGGDILGLAAAVLLFLSAFSSRVLLPVLVTVGAILMVLIDPVVGMVGQPQFTSRVAFLTAVALIGVGFGANALQKITGGRF